MNKRGNWKDKVEQFKNSGLTQTQWCIENNVPISTLSTWVCKDKKDKINADKKSNTTKETKDNVKWVKADIKTIEATKIEIKIGKFSISLEKNFDKDVFGEVMMELIKLC